MSTLARRIRQLPRRAWIVFAAALLAAIGGIAWLTSAPTEVSTDNAYLKAGLRSSPIVTTSITSCWSEG